LAFVASFEGYGQIAGLIRVNEKYGWSILAPLCDVMDIPGNTIRAIRGMKFIVPKGTMP
jgi:hypothetical protein